MSPKPDHKEQELKVEKWWSKLPNLAIDRRRAKNYVLGRIRTSDEIERFGYDSSVSSGGFRKWVMETKNMLEKIFNDPILSYEYDELERPWNGIMIADLEKEKGRLNVLLDNIETIDAPEQTSSISASSKKPLESKEIFIVHGHDNETKLNVARFLEKLELMPIILHEQPNSGRTIIEKFEDYSNVGYAVVILTPDDIGADVSDSNNLKPRARQNVILELGFFMGKLGRHRVCALYKEGVEIPSDYKGVLYVAIDEQEAWKLKLAKEIKTAGLPVDLNKIIDLK